VFDAHAFGRLLWRGRRRKLQRMRAELPGDFISTAQADIRVLDVRRLGASAQTLVIVPDPPNVIEHCMPMIDAFSPHVRVVAFELPGFGHSYPNASYRDDIAGQALAFEVLFERLGIRNAVLDMSCLGAYVGLMFARARPERVRHLMLQQVPAFREAQAWARRADLHGIIRTPWLGQLFMRGMARTVTNHWYHSALPPGHDETQHAHYAEPAFRALARGGCFCLGDAYQSLLAEPLLPAGPLMQGATVVWGAADRTHANTSHASLLQDLPGADFIEFPLCGHFPSLEMPERYYPLLQSALDRA
jgi:pimeloyl-ACP methyl ester carboxylesterase